jgi:hypothetical protein
MERRVAEKWFAIPPFQFGWSADFLVATKNTSGRIGNQLSAVYIVRMAGVNYNQS